MGLPKLSDLPILSGYKTYIAAVGLLGLAVYRVSVGDYAAAADTFMAAVAAAGIRSAISGIVNPPAAALLVALALAGTAPAQTPADKPVTVPVGAFAELVLKVQPGDKVQWRITPAAVKVVDRGDGTCYVGAKPGSKLEAVATRLNFKAEVFEQTSFQLDFLKADPTPPGPTPPAPTPPGPTPPADPLAAALRAAYAADPSADKAERVAERVALYGKAAKLAADPACLTTGQVLAGVAAEAALINQPNALLPMRKIVAGELAGFSADVPLNDAARARLAALFTQLAAAFKAAAQ